VFGLVHMMVTLRSRTCSSSSFQACRPIGRTISQGGSFTLPWPKMLALALLLISRASPQDAAVSPSFEVASVKRAAPLASGAGVSRRLDAGQVAYRHVSLKLLIIDAWKLKFYQIVGPGWLDTEFYDVVAKVPAGVGMSNVPAMLQQLLRERFGLQVRRETSLQSGYVLLVRKGGLKLRPSKPTGPLESAATQRTPAEPPPRTVLAPGQIRATGVTMDRLAAILSTTLGRPVADMTGVAGEFDFNLSIAPDESESPARTFLAQRTAAGQDAPASIFTSLGSVGLKLESRKVLAERLVIEKANKDPVEN
jgi:uncharacterized protein (TIGR03435 family)